LENLTVKDLLDDLGSDGRIALKWMLMKYGGRVWIGFIWLRMESSIGIL
jgi:hypothetical protein